MMPLPVEYAFGYGYQYASRCDGKEGPVKSEHLYFVSNVTHDSLRGCWFRALETNEVSPPIVK